MGDVTQADRDAVQAFHRVTAARLFDDIKNDTRTLGDDLGDDGDLVQAFARHRTEATTTQAAEITALKAEVKRLEYDEIHSCGSQCNKPLCVAGREIIALTAEVERLREALWTFAELADEAEAAVNSIDRDRDDFSVVQVGGYEIGKLTLDDFTTARQALGEQP